MLLDAFKKLCDDCRSIISSNDVRKAYEALDLDTTRGMAPGVVTNIFYEDIKKTLTFQRSDSDTGLAISDFRMLSSELVYRYVLCNEEPFEYLRVIRVINDAGRTGQLAYPSFSSQENWERAIISAKSQVVMSSSMYASSRERLRDDYPEEFDRAQSVKKLADLGCTFVIQNGSIDIESGVENVVADIDRWVQRLGGLTLAQCLFQWLADGGKYSQRMERYYVTREASGLSYDQKPQLPVGFLLNLCAKYPYSNKLTKNEFDSLLSKIQGISTILVNGAFGVQPYNRWHFHFQTGETIIRFCTELVLWDTLFAVPQCRPSSAVTILKRTLSFVDEEMFLTALGFSFQDFMDVMATITAKSIPLKPVTIYHSTVSKLLRHLDPDKILHILNICSHDTAANKRYVYPTDYGTLDFADKPLIRVSPTKFILMEKSWCASNYFEALAGPLRAEFSKGKSDFDKALGLHVEEVIKQFLREKGVTFSSGKYFEDKMEGECDLLVESSEGIVLLEVKKKILTRKARSGSDIDLLLDLSDSILSAHLQTGRTEIILRKKGSVRLKSNESIQTTVELNERRIERFAVTQKEYGAFHDRTVLDQFLGALLTHAFGTHSEDPIVQKRFTKLSQMREDWVEQYRQLNKLDPNFSHFPFFNCHFLGLAQLVEVINMSDSNDSFYQNIVKNKHISLGTLDWYREFELAHTQFGGTSTSGESQT